MDDTISLALRHQYSQYARQLLYDLGMSDLEQPLRGQLTGAIETYVGQVVTNVLLMNLDQETLEKIADLTDKGEGQDEIIAFLIASVPGIQGKIQQAVKDSYQTLKEQITNLTKELGAQAVAAGHSQLTGQSLQSSHKRSVDVIKHDTPDQSAINTPQPFPWEESADKNSDSA